MYKRQLLKILAATLQPDSGSIEYQPQQLKAQMGYMPQKPYIYDFSVLKNILIAFNHSEPNQEKAISALQRVGMEDFASARGSRLSGGESQRVAFARMLVEPHPPVSYTHLQQLGTNLSISGTMNVSGIQDAANGMKIDRCV